MKFYKFNRTTRSFSPFIFKMVRFPDRLHMPFGFYSIPILCRTERVFGNERRIKEGVFDSGGRYDGRIITGDTPGYVIALQLDLPSGFKGKNIQPSDGASVHFDCKVACNRPDMFSITALVKIDPCNSVVIKDVPENSDTVQSFVIYDSGVIPGISKGG